MTHGADRTRRIAHRLLRWYPKPWRARYCVEMRELVDEMPVRWRQVGDLAIGAAREWMSPRAFGWPARSAVARVQNARMLKFLFGGLVIEGIAHVARSAAPAGVSAVDALRLPILIALLTVVALRLLVAVSQAVSRRRLWPVTTSEIVFWYVMLLVGTVALHFQPDDGFQRNPYSSFVTDHLQAFIWANNLYWFSQRTKRLQKLYTAHLQRRTPPLHQSATPITGWDSSDKRSSDRFW